MAAQKRALDEASGTPRSKKTKVSDNTDAKPSKSVQPVSNLLTEEVDFPRGGGTTLTPAEVKAIRAEGIKEANEELIQVCYLCLGTGHPMFNPSRTKKNLKRGSAGQTLQKQTLRRKQRMFA